MGSNGWFADVTGRKRIEIPELGTDAWIEVRQELSVGEQRAMFKRAFLGQVTLDDGKVRNEYDTAELSFAQVLAYLVDWSNKAPIEPDTIKALDSVVYGYIETAIQKHVAELEKNGQPPAGKRPRSKTSIRPTGDAPTSISVEH